MSYLSGPRLVFAGDFQADVSTVNNDVRHYDTKTFEERFQDPAKAGILNGWWNPVGSGAFRLVSCRIQGVSLGDGTWIEDPARDPAIGLYVANALDAPAAKLVDLDPQWQMASMIWGLTVRLTDGKTPGHLIGRFAPAPFRDLSLRQFAPVIPNGQRLGGYFQSVLTDLNWDFGAGFASPAMEELRAAAKEGLLSIILNTFAYYSRPGTERFTIGRVVGAIGVATADEPRHFVLGRRFAPAKNDPNSDPDYTPEGLNYFTAAVDEARGLISVDLGSALPLADPLGKTQDIGRLMLAVLTQADPPDPFNAPLAVQSQGQVIGPNDYVVIGEIPYLQPDWLVKTAGIATFKLDAKTQALAQQRPLALLQLLITPGQARIAIRETIQGYYVRADAFEQRLNPGAQAPGQVMPTDSVDVQLYASQYGKPLAQASIDIALSPPLKGQGGAGPNEKDPPKAPIPEICKPQDALVLPNTITTQPSGGAALRITAKALTRPPRSYIDGQVYVINYNLSIVNGWQLFQQHSLDGIFLHVREPFTPPAQPTWEADIQPILKQYGNLYPVMSRWLVDLSDYESVKAHRDILELAFSRDFADANYMPATRELSPAKQAMILQWLRQRGADGSYTLARGTPKAPVAAFAEKALVAPEPASISPEAERRSERLSRIGLAKGQGFDN
ncbi:MAG TPA: hypothetical protein VF815_38250 [Myxococcaceae bacterium]|jgi:hypothetical protein